MTRKLLPFLSVFFVTACNTDYSIETKAHIFERKILDNGKLMICYAFNSGKGLIMDSSVIENHVIPQDSVVVVFQKNNPANSNLLLIPGN